MKDYTLKYGKGSVTFALDEAHVTELYGTPVPKIDDIRAALYATLSSPVSHEPLESWVNPKDKVALIVSDMSRFWMRQDLVVPHIISYLTDKCDVNQNNITIIIANGTHPGGDENELRTLVTDGVYDRIRVVNHDCQAKDLVYIGTTSLGTEVRINPIAANADKVIMLGACTYHVMAGYGGGRKSILPGISGLETIRQNHLHSLDLLAPRSNPLIGNGVTDGNPLNEDMCQAAAMVKNLFGINLVTNADMQLAHIISGDPMKAWQLACHRVDEIYRVPIVKKADVIITSCGGYPKDMSLYQGTKIIDNVESGLNAGGTLIVLMEAVEGGGPAQYFDWLKPLKEGRLYEELKAGFTIPGYIFFMNCEQAKKYRIMLLTTADPSSLAPMGIEAYTDMAALLAAADIADKDILLIPNGSTVVPYPKA